MLRDLRVVSRVQSSLTRSPPVFALATGDIPATLVHARLALVENTKPPAVVRRAQTVQQENTTSIRVRGQQRIVGPAVQVLKV